MSLHKPPIRIETSCVQQVSSGTPTAHHCTPPKKTEISARELVGMRLRARLRPYIEKDDLIQCAKVALIQAIDSYQAGAQVPLKAQVIDSNYDRGQE
jgi:hypothetical protein